MRLFCECARGRETLREKALLKRKIEEDVLKACVEEMQAFEIF